MKEQGTDTNEKVLIGTSKYKHLKSDTPTHAKPPTKQQPKPKTNPKTKPYQPKGPRPFEPESEAAKMTLNEHVQYNVRIWPSAREHQRKKLESKAVRQKRISSLNRSFTEHRKNQESGGKPQGESARTMVLNGLKRQELETLQAFGAGSVKEDEALYKLLELGFLNKMISGPAFHRADLHDGDLAAIEAFRYRCLEAFRKENAPGGK